MDKIELIKALAAQNGDAAMLTYHRERGVFLIAVGKLHLQISDLAKSQFDGDLRRSIDFLEGLLTDERGFPEGSRESVLCDRLCYAVIGDEIDENTAFSAILAAMTPDDPDGTNK